MSARGFQVFVMIFVGVLAAAVVGLSVYATKLAYDFAGYLEFMYGDGGPPDGVAKMPSMSTRYYLTTLEKFGYQTYTTSTLVGDEITTYTLKVIGDRTYSDPEYYYTQYWTTLTTYGYVGYTTSYTTYNPLAGWGRRDERHAPTATADAAASRRTLAVVPTRVVDPTRPTAPPTQPPIPPLRGNADRAKQVPVGQRRRFRRGALEHYADHLRERQYVATNGDPTTGNGLAAGLDSVGFDFHNLRARYAPLPVLIAFGGLALIWSILHLIISHVSPTNGWVSIQADLIITFIIWAIGFAGLIAATHLFPIYLGGPVAIALVAVAWLLVVILLMYFVFLWTLAAGKYKGRRHESIATLVNGPRDKVNADETAVPTTMYGGQPAYPKGASDASSLKGGEVNGVASDVNSVNTATNFNNAHNIPGSDVNSTNNVNGVNGINTPTSPNSLNGINNAAANPAYPTPAHHSGIFHTNLPPPPGQPPGGYYITGALPPGSPPGAPPPMFYIPPHAVPVTPGYGPSESTIGAHQTQNQPQTYTYSLAPGQAQGYSVETPGHNVPASPSLGPVSPLQLPTTTATHHNQ